MNKQIKSIPLLHHLKEVLGAWLLIGSSLLLLACCTEVDRLQERSEAMVNFSLSSDALIPEVAPTRAAAVDMETGTAVRVLAYRRPDGSGSAVLSSANYVGEATYKVTSGSALEPVSAPLQLIAGTYDFYAVTPDLAVDHSGDEPTLEVRHRTDYAVSLTSKSISPGNSTVELITLERRCALLCFETDRKEGATGITSIAIQDATLTAMAKEPQQATGVGQLTPTTDGPDLVLTQFDNSTDADKACQSEGKMVVLPKSSSASTLKMNVKFNEESPVKLEADLPDVVFESGKKYTFSIRFQEQGKVIELLLKITPWTSLVYDAETGKLEDLPVKVIVLGKWTDISYGDISQGGLGDMDSSIGNSGWESSDSNTSQGGLGGLNAPVKVSGWEYLGKETTLAGLGSLNNPFKVEGWGTLANNVQIGEGNLSRDASGNPATANCYIVTTNSEVYSFNATVPGNNSNVTGITKPTGLLDATVARVIWQTGTSATTGLVVDPNSIKLQDGKVFFVTGSAIAGNAVIGIFASSAANAPCLWSWHIWKLTSKPMDVDCTKYLAGNTNTSVAFKMMGWNLGAYNNIQGNTNSIGLLYQWGRKDPFPGPAGFNDTEPSNIYGSFNNNGTTGIWNGVYTIKTISMNSSVGSETWTVKYPTMFITHLGDWMYTKNENLWGTPWMNGGTGNYNYNSGKKTIYDPCPIGYRVPPHDTWSKVTNGSVVNNGMVLGGISGNFWFPITGCRYCASGKIEGVTCGYYWMSSTSGPLGGQGGNFCFIDSTLHQINGSNRAGAVSVRCVSE